MRDFLDHASKMYYQGTPIISDAEFDILSSHFNYKTIGYAVTDGIPHFHRMYSLQNCFDIAKAPIDLNVYDYIRTPKLDGAAISLLYVGGTLSLALTRGDGKLGRDITEKAELLVPVNITNKEVIQITGEVVAPSHIPNSRNFAAGSLNLKSLDEFHSRPLSFVAYDVKEHTFTYWSEAMKHLADMGFRTVINFDPTHYPTDGVVFRVDNMAEYNAMGFTGHHPRGAFALKEQKAGVVTTLLDVIWQVGKSGVVSPVAVLEPVKIDDAVVSRATLHNIEYINGLNLEIGCKVEVIRSAEIIPRIVRRVD